MATITLNAADKTILIHLSDGRNLAANIARETDYTSQYLSERLARLREHGIVTNIGAGLYELNRDEYPEERTEVRE